MNKEGNLKLAIINQLFTLVNEKIDSALKSIESAKESRDNETKSSVGDKYETGRAMMQMELEKSQLQLNKALSLKNELKKINLQKKYNSAEFGSLVHSTGGNYFLSIGIGKIKIEDKIYYSISLGSPIGKILKNKIIGDKISFQKMEITITEIV